jgi:hypothetical protein
MTTDEIFAKGYALPLYGSPTPWLYKGEIIALLPCDAVEREYIDGLPGFMVAKVDNVRNAAICPHTSVN